MPPLHPSRCGGAQLLRDYTFGQLLKIASVLASLLEPTEGFTPTKPFKTRLKWRDREGNERSRLLLTKPQSVLQVLSDRGTEQVSAKRRAPSRPRRRRAAREAGTANTQ